MCWELFDAAKDIGVKVVTNNSEVQVICQNGKALFRPAHTLDDLNRLHPTAVKHVPKLMSTFGRSSETVKRRKNDKLGLLKIKLLVLTQSTETWSIQQPNPSFYFRRCESFN